MVRSFVGSSFVVAALALAPACGDDGGGSTASPSQLYETWSAAFCDILVSCEAADDELFLFRLLATADKGACRTFLTHMFEQRGPDEDVETVIADGRIIYHGDRLSTCISAAKATCSLDLEDIPACAEVLEGTVAAAGSCWIDEECAGDAFCAQTDSDCVGSCVARPKRGEACAFFGSNCSQTEGPTGCGPDTDSCLPRTVVEDVAAGAACGTEYSDTEITARRCASGHYCHYDSDSDTQSCVAYAGEGQACGNDARCSGGLACVPSTGESYACQPVAVATSVGAPCNETDLSQPLIGCNVFSRLYCDDGTCKALGDGSVGSSCATNFEIDGVCDPDTYCDDDSATCMAAKADGAPCESSSECLSGGCSGEDGALTCTATTCE